MVEEPGRYGGVLSDEDLKEIGSPHGLGRWGEALAARFLVGLGMEILERNRKERQYEIDVIARDGQELVVVEVRTRRANRVQGAADSVGMGKLSRVVAGGTGFVEKVGFEGNWRVDLIAVTVVKGFWTLEHIRNIENALF